MYGRIVKFENDETAESDQTDCQIGMQGMNAFAEDSASGFQLTLQERIRCVGREG